METGSDSADRGSASTQAPGGPAKTPAQRETELFWIRLIEKIRERRVIPIVGQDLITIERNGGQVPLDALLAAGLAAGLGVKAKGTGLASVSQVAARYRQGHNMENVYTVLQQAMVGLGDVPIPQALLKLAAIEPLKLFVSTTCDDLLERAIKEARPKDPKVDSISYFPSEDLRVADLPEGLPSVCDLESPTVFHLMGQLKPSPNYAVTEEDTLEFMRSLAGRCIPTRLLSELANKNNLVLVIGTGFPDWLARFFVRLTRNVRLSANDVEIAVVVDPGVASKPLRDFFKSFSSKTQLFEQRAGEFVDELSRRWNECLPSPPKVLGPMDPGSVFISYASQDRSVAAEIKNSLTNEGVPVWFDQTSLRGGHQWRGEIEDNIRKCTLFMPIISKNIFVTRLREFPREWELAVDVVKGLLWALKEIFIFPVLVGAISFDDEEVRKAVPEIFAKYQWIRLPNGSVTPEFCEAVTTLYRAHKWLEERYRKRREGAS